MLSRKSLPILIALLAFGVFFGFNGFGFESAPPSKYEKIFRNLGDMLSQAHYSPKAFNDDFSKEIFKKYIEELDRDKNIFLDADIKALKKYETVIDDELKGAPIQFFPAVSELYQKRMLEVAPFYEEILSKPFDFSKDEKVILDPSRINFPKNEQERKQSWQKRLKYLTLERYAAMVEEREKNKGKEGFIVKSDAELQAEAREKVRLIMSRYFERLKNKFTDEDRFNLLVNTIATAMDPHTNFFPPVDKRYFDEQMSGRFFGIGAQLREEEGGIKVISVITGTPAWKSGEIQAGDFIVKVAEEGAEPVDLTGYAIDEAVKVIRGKKGSTVVLTLKKIDGSQKIVKLRRDEIVQDETFARSVIINGKSKIGYIFLPEFYADFERPDGARCAVDVAKEIMKLKAENVDGIVMDLRNNGGGSLMDVVQMVGYFIPEGPIVQVKDREGQARILPDRDKSVLYDGPLVVMVNEYSASASEIFAAAIQDYKRGIVIGSTSTYGKGTVQRNIGLDRESLFNPNSELGSVKLTLQKFYRISGGSTQLRGVESDIVLPDVYEFAKIREKDNPSAMPWDEIAKADYKVWNSGIDFDEIKKRSAERVKNHEAFEVIRKNSEWLALQNDAKEYSLSLSRYLEQQKKIRETVQQIERLNKLKDKLNITSHASDMDRLKADKSKADRYEAWLNSLREDIYLDETVKVIEDMIANKHVAAQF